MIRMFATKPKTDGLASTSSGESLKPTHVFYVWYTELCRRGGMATLNYVKPPKLKNDNVLDFACDRIKPEEWVPLINALRLDESLHVIGIHCRNRCKFLFEVDTEEKVKQMKRRAGSLFTTYISRALYRALGNCIKHNRVLTSLQLEGVPFYSGDVESLVDALKKNTVVKILSLNYTEIGDLGCQTLCRALQMMPNIEVLNLSSCGLGPTSAQSIAKVVRCQQINRYCESWHNSLRYEDPEITMMAGLKRITLNNNPSISDEGVTYILDELDDDLWIKALDMQRCGVTESVGSRLVDVVKNSRSLLIADFRNNDLSPNTIDYIFDLLKGKADSSGGNSTQFKWCFTSSSLRSSPTVQELPSNCSIFYPAGKSKSMPYKNSSQQIITLRRSKTAATITKNTSTDTMDHRISKHIIIPGVSNMVTNHTNLVNRNSANVNMQNSLMCLNDELKRETRRRIQSEEENRRLKEELKRIKSSTQPTAKEKTIKFDPLPKKKRVVKAKNGMRKSAPNETSHRNGYTTSDKKNNNCTNLANNYCLMHKASNSGGAYPKVEFVFDRANKPGNILKNLMASKRSSKHRNGATQDVNADMVSYFQDLVEECKKQCDVGAGDSNDTASQGSQASLIQFVRDLKSSRSGGGWKAATFLQKVH